jgi:hypothetical protein
MRKLLYVMLIIAFSTHCHAQDLRLNLHSENDSIVISLGNLSSKDIKINKLFTLNPASGLIDINIFVENKRLGFQFAPNEPLPTESDYVALRQFEVIGRIFRTSDIRRWFGITKKCFQMSAKYHDVMAKDHDAFANTLKSGQITICQ